MSIIYAQTMGCPTPPVSWTRPPCSTLAMLRPLFEPADLARIRAVLGDAVELHHGTRNAALRESVAASGPGRGSPLPLASGPLLVAVDWTDVASFALVGFFVAIYLAAVIAQLVLARCINAECEACRAAEARRVGP